MVKSVADRLFLLGLLLLLAACTDKQSNQNEDESDGESDEDSDDESAADSDSDSDSDSDQEEDEGLENDDNDDDVDSGEFPKSCADLYAEDIVPEFEVQIEPSEWAGLEADCEDQIKAYHPIVFKYGDEQVDAMMRLKGNWSWSCEKMQFLISFNEVNKDGRFHGLRKIVLDAPWYDPTLLHERMAFLFMERYGTPYSCVNNAKLYINGTYYGVYANVERVDREYLERHFDDPDGNLYKEGMELKTNESDENIDNTNMERFWASQSVGDLEQVLEIEQAIKVWAGLAMVPDPDSYWAGVEINFYLYDHPARGLLFLPYDMDISFAEELWPQLSVADPITYEHWEWLREDQYRIILSDERWCNVFFNQVVTAYGAYDVGLFESKLEAWSSQIASAVADDPNRTFTMDEHQDALALMRTFPSRRAAFVEQWLQEGGHCPVDWPRRDTWRDE